MSRHQLDKAQEATRPSAHDIAVASEAVLAAAGTGLVHTEHLFSVVGKRLAEEPIPDVAREIQGVTEPDVRQARAKATTLTALAQLEARGALLPLSGAYPDQIIDLPCVIGGNYTGYRIEGYNFRIAAVYRGLPYASLTPTIDSPAIFLDRLPTGMGDKVRRAVRESVDTYRAGLSFAAVILLGVASEAAWGQLARAMVERTQDAKLRQALEDPFASAAEVQRKTDDLIRRLHLPGLELNALDALEQIYRDLRNYAAHRPDESFDEVRVDRAVVGTLLEGSVDYFRRLYEIQRAVEGHP